MRVDRERHEWIGGRRQLPFYVHEPEMFRPEMRNWLEMPADVVVAGVLAAVGEAPPRSASARDRPHHSVPREGSAHSTSGDRLAMTASAVSRRRCCDAARDGERRPVAAVLIDPSGVHTSAEVRPRFRVSSTAPAGCVRPDRSS